MKTEFQSTVHQCFHWSASYFVIQGESVKERTAEAPTDV